MPASARESGEIAQRADGAVGVAGHAAAAIGARLRAARIYARAPELPFTTRSLTRTERVARSRRAVAWAAAIYAAVALSVVTLLLEEGEPAATAYVAAAALLAIGAAAFALLWRAAIARSAAYRDPLLTMTIAADRFTAHAAALVLIDAPWRALRVVDLLYDKASLHYGTIVELAGIVVEHGGKHVTIDPQWVVKGRAAATAVVLRLIAARRLLY